MLNDLPQAVCGSSLKLGFQGRVLRFRCVSDHTYMHTSAGDMSIKCSQWHASPGHTWRNENLVSIFLITQVRCKLPAVWHAVHLRRLLSPLTAALFTAPHGELQSHQGLPTTVEPQRQSGPQNTLIWEVKRLFKSIVGNYYSFKNAPTSSMLGHITAFLPMFSPVPVKTCSV